MIETFKDEYAFLSNFQELPRPIRQDGLVFHSVETFYQAMKFTDRGIQVQLAALGAGKSKTTARKLVKQGLLRPDWPEIQQRVMFLALVHKFLAPGNEQLKHHLMGTRMHRYIQEGNWHKDKYWGFCFHTNKGENILGLMLMVIRNECYRREGLRPIDISEYPLDKITVEVEDSFYV